MKNLKADPEDTLRAEYKRSDFGELVEGKYATTQVDFQQLTEALLTCVAEDEGMKFKHHSIDNYLASHTLGDWTYEIDNTNQVTLRYWLNEFDSIQDAISNPAIVISARDRTELQDALLTGVTNLKAKVAALKR